MAERTHFLRIKTTEGQERAVAEHIWQLSKSYNLPIKSVLVIDKIKGHVFLEVSNEGTSRRVFTGRLRGSKVGLFREKEFFPLFKKIKHIRELGWRGIVKFSDIEHFLTKPKPIIEELKVGDIIEVIKGPLKGRRARVIRIDKHKMEVAVEILDMRFALTVTLPEDCIRIVEKA